MKKIIIFIIFLTLSLAGIAQPEEKLNLNEIKEAWLYVFNQLDKNKKGYLTKSDFNINALTLIAREKYFNEIDQDKNNQINYIEFNLFIDKQIIKQQIKLNKRWQELDTNNDHLISRKEIGNNLYFNWYFAKIDLNKDNYISKQEFIIFLASQIRDTI